MIILSQGSSCDSGLGFLRIMRLTRLARIARVYKVERWWRGPVHSYWLLASSRYLKHHGWMRYGFLWWDMCICIHILWRNRGRVILFYVLMGRSADKLHTSSLWANWLSLWSSSATLLVLLIHVWVVFAGTYSAWYRMFLLVGKARWSWPILSDCSPSCGECAYSQRS